MLLDKTITQLASEIKNRDITSVDIVQECYTNIEKYNSQLNAFITIIDKDHALDLAKKSAEKEPRTLLHGMPFIIKDSYNTKGIRTTAGSSVLGNYVSVYNATVYQKLLEAGAILIGKMNMDAWGHGATSENNDFGPVHNPWDVSRVAGGSSGGNAAALASRMAVFGIGEDTGGSIRNPSAWCNITGLKVTYGRVSRFGCIAYTSSFDTVGPMAKTAEDCAIIMEAIAGQDKMDATSSTHKIPIYSQEINEKPKNIIIGVPKEMFSEGLDQEISASIKSAISVFEKLNFKIKEVSIPLIEYGIPVYYVISTSETSSNLARFDGVRFGFGRNKFTQETMRRIMIGTYALSAGYYDAYYKKAQKMRTLFIEAYEKAFNECDVLIMPVTPTGPPKIGETINDPLQNLLLDIYTTTQNPAGVPSLALPCGFTKNGLPIGMQLVGKMFSESLLLQLGYAYQQVTSWHTQKPGLLTK